MNDEPFLSEGAERAGYRRRRKLFFLALILGTLSICLLIVVGLGLRTLLTREPVTTLPVVNAAMRDTPPHYLFSIFNVNKPIGVGVSPDGGRIYVAESEGDRLIRVFTREGKEVFSFAPPGTTSATRVPTYLAVARERVYVADRMQHSIFVFDLNGQYVDTIYAPGGKLSEWVATNRGNQRVPTNGGFAHLMGDQSVRVLDSKGKEAFALRAPAHDGWQPLGVRAIGDALYITDVTENHHRVVVIDARTAKLVKTIGHEGASADQFEYPNAAVVDASGRMIVSDGNNGRLVVIDARGNSSIFAKGNMEGAVSLPGGLAIDREARLYVVDSVNQGLHVYDLGQKELRFMFSFGETGNGAGQFSFPSDVAVDSSGRLTVSDTMNDRVQIWSY